MNFNELLDLTKLRLSESSRPDRGWFLITRLHLDIEKLSKIATYFDMAGIGERRSIRNADYRSIARAIKVSMSSDDPGSNLRRHWLLAMTTPLRLLEKDGSWESVRLTDYGSALAKEADKHAVLELVLKDVVFCKEPWFTADRVAEYADYDIRPYPAILEIMESLDGYVHRDEYGLFIYNLRLKTEVPWAIDMIRNYRQLGVTDQKALVNIVETAISQYAIGHDLESGKILQNWRDMQLHTFTMFSLGSSCVLDGHNLIFSERYVKGALQRGSGSSNSEKVIVLRRPDGNDDLSVPPPVRANSGSAAEQFVAKILTSQGWEVIFYTDKRGYGFDLWAKKDDVAVLIEVKSSTGILSVLELTETEMTAASEYKESYVIAIVENLESSPEIHYVHNPSQTLALQEVLSKHFKSSRSEWEPLSADAIVVQN